ncbi:choice-of-anchor M domain-containing protein [Verrucomicrobium spinosum]|uniref:choice-of-anchor M domain-containing protein n=1 Tax=Verrucomicrobium spinosum TaxID=2736 RepID=UPI0009D6F1AC|nr:choice-of-anchor M domain-containing protein [Verrucomicrobium spinosum]
MNAPIRIACHTLMLLGALASRLDAAITVLGPGHMDFDINVDSSGEWSTSLSHDVQGAFATDTDSVLYLINQSMPTGSRAARPSGSQWSFLGTPAGGNVWILPQTQSASPNAVWLGLSTEGTSASYLGAWDPAHTSVASGQWIELRLLGVEYHGNETNNQFSMWLTDGFGNPNVWMDTADGIATTGLDDVYYMPIGGHVHMNWGFTSMGIYDVTFEARTYLANGSESISEDFTVRFGVNATDVVPEPGRGLLLMLGLSMLLGRRGRRRIRG